LTGGSVSVFIGSEPPGLGNYTVFIPVISVNSDFGALKISPDTQITVKKSSTGTKCEYSTQQSLATLFVVATCQGGSSPDPDQTNRSPTGLQLDSETPLSVLESNSVNWVLVGGCAGGGIVFLALAAVGIGMLVRIKRSRVTMRRIRAIRHRM
jgi:hypothetical protein